MEPTKIRKLTHKGARQKGKRLEHEITKALKNIGIDAQRVPLSGALSWLKGDVTEFSTIKPHVHECKNCEALELNAWWRQAADQNINGEVPVLHFSSNYKRTYTVLNVAEFDEMVESYERFRPSLNMTLVDFPKRKNFWKFIELHQTTKLQGYLYHYTPVDLTKHDEEDLIIIPLETYLMLRRMDIKRRAADVLAPVA